MTKIDFYVGMHEQLDFAYRLVRKAYRQQEKLMVTGENEILKEFDVLLWNAVPTDFIPHCFVEKENIAEKTPIVLSVLGWQSASYDILINLGRNLPRYFSRYQRLLEVVGSDVLAIKAARSRYRIYKNQGYFIKSHKIIAS